TARVTRWPAPPTTTPRLVVTPPTVSPTEPCEPPDPLDPPDDPLVLPLPAPSTPPTTLPTEGSTFVGRPRLPGLPDGTTLGTEVGSDKLGSGLVTAPGCVAWPVGS